MRTRARYARVTDVAWLRRGALTLGIGAVLALGASAPPVAPAAIYAQVRMSTVDIWLTNHPAIASAMIWEFPPTRTVIPLRKRFILWPGPRIEPDPGLFPPLGDNVLPDLTVGRSLTSEFTVESAALEPLAGGVQTTALGGDWSPYEAVPGNLPDWNPGGVQTNEYGAEIRSWSKWPDWAKQELRDRYAAYAQWAQNACPLYADYAESGFAVKPAGFDAAFSSIVDPDPMPVLDPPINIQPDDALLDGIPWAMVMSQQAFALYVRLVAAQLAIEIKGCVPWSVTEYSATDLRPLFDGRLIFRYVPAGLSEWGTMTATGHVVTSTVTPAPPLIVLGFLAQHGLIGATRTDTVVRLFEWERTHLHHVVGGTTAVPYPSGVLYFNYNGRAPVSRMINGTSMAAPVFFSGGASYFEPEVRGWVGGCGGNSGFNPEVLRVVNVAAHRTAYAHFQNYLALDDGLHAGIGHGDDPYSLANGPEIPESEILIDDATFQAWFVDESDPAIRLKHVSQRVADLYIAYLPNVLLVKHCEDLYVNNDHASSRVYNWAFSSTYSVAELEAMGLWTALDAKVASLGGCGAISY